MTQSEENPVVMHTHTRAGMAIAALQEGLLPISVFLTPFYNRVGYHDYEGASLYPDERERIVASHGPHKALILRNHGLLVVGRTVAGCFLRLNRLERACQVQVDAAAAGTLAHIPGPVIPSARPATSTATRTCSRPRRARLNSRR